MGKFSCFKREFAIDKDAAENGIWAEVPGGNGARMRICRWEGPRHLKKIQEILKSLTKRYKGRVFATEDSIEVQKEVCIRALVTDWEKVPDENGKDIKFSPDNLREALNDDEFGDELTKWIVLFAKERTNYQIFEIEADTKNLKKS